MDIILIQMGTKNLPGQATKDRYKFPPLGLLFIGTILKLHGYDVKIIDLLTQDFTLDSFRKELHTTKGQPLAVGISVYTENFFDAIEIAQIIKKEFPKTKIIFGGAHVKGNYEEALEYKAVDFVTRTEGEGNIIELLESIKYPASLPLEKVRGIAFRDKDKKIKVTNTYFITNLDTLPFPAYYLINREYYRKTFLFVTSRGCPGNCIFCASTAFSGTKYRMHTAEWIFALIYFHFKKYHITDFGVMDDTFTVDKLRTKRFCLLLLKNKINLAWTVKSRVDSIDEETVNILSKSHCKSIHIGVESGDQEVLNTINKRITLEQVFKAIEIMAKYRVRTECSFMIGHHADTLETIEKTLILCKSLQKVVSSVIAISTPFPGTRLYSEQDKLGITVTTKNWRMYDLYTPIYYTNNFSLNDIRKAHFMFVNSEEFLRNNSILTQNNHKELWDQLDSWRNKLIELSKSQSLNQKEQIT